MYYPKLGLTAGAWLSGRVLASDVIKRRSNVAARNTLRYSCPAAVGALGEVNRNKSGAQAYADQAEFVLDAITRPNC